MRLADSQYFDPRLFARVANLQLIARTVVEGMLAGRHRSPFRGFSVEFSEYRKYSPGDDPKFIDWKVLAKSDKVYVKEFEAETNLRAWILADMSASMGYGGGPGPDKFQYACCCMAALAYLMIRQQDAVGLAAFDSGVRRFLAPRSGPRHLQDMLAVLGGLVPAGESDLSASFHVLAERLKRRGLILVFSDFFEDPVKVVSGLAHFRHRRHEVVLFQIVDPREQDFPFEEFVEFEDLETGRRLPVQARQVGPAYRKAFERFTGDLRARCAERGIEHVLLRTDTPVETALLQYLRKRSRIG